VLCPVICLPAWMTCQLDDASSVPFAVEPDLKTGPVAGGGLSGQLALLANPWSVPCRLPLAGTPRVAGCQGARPVWLTQAEIARALYGNWRAEHLFALQHAVTLYDCYREQLRVCDGRMQTYLATFVDQSQGRPRPRRHGHGRRERRRDDPAFDVAGALYRMSGVDLTVLEAIDPNTAFAFRRSSTFVVGWTLVRSTGCRPGRFVVGGCSVAPVGQGVHCGLPDKGGL
jgi:hypothetical protein